METWHHLKIKKRATPKSQTSRQINRKIEMKSIKTVQAVFLVAMIGLISATFTGCKNEGCSDLQADNYDQDADKDDGFMGRFRRLAATRD
jgi:hypothetical protein